MKREFFLDINSNKLKVGDIIVCTIHSNLTKGKITRFTDKNIIINQILLSGSVSPYETMIKAYNNDGNPNTYKIGE